MTDPFKLMGKMFVAAFRITGYLVVFIIQVFIYLFQRRLDKVGDTFGYLGRGVVDAVADIFRS